ncbi:MAG: TonB-dependent receptor plug domain-containing protein [Candidatus Omnitrophica bacterium]|nr:TonB-dependent receptor plug domain-containing protein [Candidatus Omnitrophota bacterium]
MKLFPRKAGLFLLAMAVFSAAPLLAAEETTSLQEVTVSAPKESGSPLPDVEGARIYAGKKTTVAYLQNVPQIQANNYRQGFAQMPGLLVAEQYAPSHANLNYRGVGDPHETEYLLVMKDGIPIVSDWFGYSTLYYSPPLESIERIEFIRGGSSLLYGPQPGPVLNYVTSLPPEDRILTGSTQHIMGSNGLYATFHSFGGTRNSFGYSGHFNHRQANGPRENSDYSVFSGNLKGLYRTSNGSRIVLNADIYRSESGEAGRLTQAQYTANRNLTRTSNDRIWIERYVPSISLEKDLSEETLLTVKSWGGYQDRFSRRQTGSATNLDRQEFNFFGTDARLRHTWEGWGNTHTATGGFVVYTSDSPRSRERGVSPQTTSGIAQFDLDRNTNYGALFFENAFKFGRLGVVPAFRVDIVNVSVEELFNTTVNRSLINTSDFSAVPLGALGATFDLNAENQVYGNVSQGYRPVEYDDLANPTSSTQAPPSDLKESRTWTYEAGVRGVPTPWFQYDTSIFLIDYDNFIENRTLGSGNVERSNSGRAIYKGWEAAAEADVIGFYDALAGTEHGQKVGRLGVFGNVSILDAEFVSGSNDGREPAYAPTYLLRFGANYRLGSRLKASLSSQFVDEHFWQDNNAAGTVGTDKVDSYKVWDAALEAKVYKETVSVIAGVNNIFNEDYYARVRTDGIDPASERTVYAGVKFEI